MGAYAQGTSISLLNYFLRCPSTGSYFIMSFNGQVTCVPVPNSVTTTTSPPTISFNSVTPVTPKWQLDTISLSSLAAGATSISFTTTKTPIVGVILWWYNSNNITLQNSGSTIWNGNPTNFTLPSNWATTDSITIVYQYQ